GYSPFTTSPATVYNRYGYAMLGLIILEAFTPRNGTRTDAEFRGGASTAFLAVLLFFLKITFFVAAVFLIVVLAFCRSQTGRRLAGLICGVVAMSLPFCAYFGFHMMPMIRDLITVAGAKRVHLRAYEWDSIVADEGVLVSFAIVTSVILLIHHRRNSARAVLIAAAAVGLGGVILILGNCEPHGLPLSLFFVLIAASRLDCKSLGNAQLFCGATLLWTSVFTATALAPSVLGFAYGTVLRSTSALFGTPLAGKALAHFVPIDSDTEYREFVNDGLSLVQQHRQPGDTVMSLDFTNPFSYGLGMKPAPGGTTALHYQTTFNDLHRPTAERLFGAARLVMVPKTFSDPSLQGSIPRLYGPYLASHFRQAGESARWRLYRSID
ncbi:MAG: hypothetical protein M3Z36_12525, partial [Acidobacteriota bacterium]|nr:hypothetical protein [Acidobacteriota bacterium]